MNRLNNKVPGRAASRGFTLIEALVAFVVMAAGLLALLSFYSTSQTNIGEAKVQAEAASVAEAKLHELESFLTGDDARLNASDCESTVSPVPGEHQVGSFDLCWDVEDTGGDGSRKMARVTVSWEDRDGNEQNVVMSSEINFREPTQSIEQFLRLAQSNATDDEDGSEWVGPGQEDREIMEEIPVAEYEEQYGPVPDDYAEDAVYIYKITISGSITTDQHVDSETGQIEGPEVNSIDPQLDNVYSPECQWSATSYSCDVFYVSLDNGWAGSIDYVASESGNKWPDFVAPTAVQEPIEATTESCTSTDSGSTNTLTANFVPLVFSTEVNVDIDRVNNSPC